MSNLVYSTKSGKIIPTQEQEVIPPIDTVVKIRRETKHRAGKTIISISDIPLSLADLKKLTAQLKKCCSAGGSLKGRVIEIQGEHATKIAAQISKMGFKVKQIGG